MRQEVIESVLESFEDQPSNLTMIQEYERMAKTHLNNYLEALLENRANKLPKDQGNLLMGIVYKTVRGQRSVNLKTKAVTSPKKRTKRILSVFHLFFGRS